MRKIKFRAFDLDKNRWGRGDRILSQYPTDEYGEINTVAPWYHLMQYTGLHDRKGNEIFEGDIVGFHPLSEDYPERIGKIEWCDECCGGWRIQFIGITNNERFARYAGSSDVLGNIYDTPGLLA